MAPSISKPWPQSWLAASRFLRSIAWANQKCCKRRGVFEVLNFRIIEIDQGSAEWLEWRRSGIGASDAPTIMRQNPWKTVEQLRHEKQNPKFENRANAAMQRGTLLEPSARRDYCSRYNIDMQPSCIESVTIPWMKGSLDGINIDKNRVIEIKCGQSSFKYTRRTNSVPDYYYGQLQHILSITGYESIDYWSYLPLTSPILINVARDERYIETLIDSEEAFWNSIQID